MFATGHLLNWDEKKKNFGGGPRWYVQAAYDFYGDGKPDKVAFFRITNYDFDKNIPETESFAQLVISDEDWDGFPDKVFYDADENGTLEKVTELPKSENSSLVKKVLFNGEQ
ncbi:MAG: hypothetical protein KKB62_03715 [Nanoarchaeota archaeon]|nr:hypothetical protein [Nanoarchaeota archaeon]